MALGFRLRESNESLGLLLVRVGGLKAIESIDAIDEWRWIGRVERLEEYRDGIGSKGTTVNIHVGWFVIECRHDFPGASEVARDSLLEDCIGHGRGWLHDELGALEADWKAKFLKNTDCALLVGAVGLVR